MRKFFITILILIILFVSAAIFYFYSKDCSKTISTNYYLLFRKKLYISSVEKHYSTPYIRIFHNVYSNGFYINVLKYNFLTKQLTILNSRFSNDFINNFSKILSDLRLLNLPICKIEFINLNFTKNKYNYKNCFGNVYIKENIKLNINSFVSNVFFNISGIIDFKDNINIKVSFDNINFRQLSDIFKIPIPENIFLDKIHGKISLIGNLNDRLNKFLELSYKKFKLKTNLKYSNELLYIKNGKIFLDKENVVNFNGEIATSRIYDFRFFTDKPISGVINDLNFKNIKFEIIAHREIKEKNINLILKGEKVNIENLNFVKNNLINGNYKILLKSAIINGEMIKKLDTFITVSESNFNIKKLNFILGEGDFLFSYIKGKKFQVASDVKHIKIRDLFKLNNIVPKFDGKFNVTFIGEGKNKIFTYGKGFFFIENFKYYGITIDNLVDSLKNNSLINLKLIKKFNKENKKFEDNQSIGFEIVKGFIKPKGNLLNFTKIYFNNKYYYITLNGHADIKNGNNIILSGILKYKDYKTKILVNINLEKNLLQIIRKE